MQVEGMANTRATYCTYTVYIRIVYSLHPKKNTCHGTNGCEWRGGLGNGWRGAPGFQLAHTTGLMWVKQLGLEPVKESTAKVKEVAPEARVAAPEAVRAAEAKGVAKRVVAKGMTKEVTTPLHDDASSLDTLACLGMTSGSTGQPKRILVPHRMISNENWARQIALPYVGDDECLQLKRRLASQGICFGPDDAEYLEWLQSAEANEVEERYA